MTGIGIIGCGYWGPNLVRNLVQNPEVDVRGVAEQSESRRQFVEAQWPELKTTPDHRVLLEDDAVEGIFVATPAETHARLAIEALEAGKHVFVEKPLATSVEDAEAMVKLAEEKGLRLMVGHTFLYNAAVRTLRQYVDDGTLGEVYYLYLQRLNLGIVRSDVNAFWNLAPHDISIALHLIDADPVSVSATGACYLQEGVEDVVFANVKFANGAMAHIHASWLDPGKVRRATVVGSKKMAVYDDMASNKIALFDKGIEKKDVAPGKSTVAQPSTFGQHQLSTRAGDIVLPSIKFTEPLAAEVAHFIDCIRTGKTPRSDGLNGLSVVRILDAADRSIAAGGGEIPLS